MQRWAVSLVHVIGAAACGVQIDGPAAKSDANAALVDAAVDAYAAICQF